MVKTEHHYPLPWEGTTRQQQVDYYMDMPTNPYANVNLIINNKNQISSIDASQSLTADKNSSSSSSSNDYNTAILSKSKEVYPWMSEKKHGNNKNKTNSKSQSINSSTSTSSSSGMLKVFSEFHLSFLMMKKTLQKM